MEHNQSLVAAEDKSWMSTINSVLRWCPTSHANLHKAEEKILSYLTSAYKKWFVNVGPVIGTTDNYIRTLSFTENASKENETIPLVLIHGFASAVGLWVLNVDSLSDRRPVYAFDLLGFGRSSRPSFSSSPDVVESQYVESIERWRKQVGLERFVLLGHSLGAYIASAYALTFPERVDHLILADPWGYPEKSIESSKNVQIPTWVKAVGSVLQFFNPLAAVRAAGPVGPTLIERLRGDLTKKFSSVISEDSGTVIDYIYHCNAQTPSGEAAFKTLTSGFGWAKNPMINRIGNLRNDIPLTIIYGSRSWIDRHPGVQIKYMRESSYVNVHVIQGSGHHVYADNYEEFNSIVHKACELTDAACSPAVINNEISQEENE